MKWVVDAIERVFYATYHKHELFSIDFLEYCSPQGKSRAKHVRRYASWKTSDVPLFAVGDIVDQHSVDTLEVLVDPGICTINKLVEYEKGLK